MAGPKPIQTSALRAAFSEGRAKVAVVGLGYVGLPLCEAAVAGGFDVLGFDIDPAKIKSLNAGKSYFKHLGDARVGAMRASGRFRASGVIGDLLEADAIILCVPTPLAPDRSPDLSFVINTTKSLLPVLRGGQLIVLESTTYPGTTRDVVAPLLAQSGLVCGEDFFLAYSPEREDPGNPDFTTGGIPKIVGGLDPISRDLALALYGRIVAQTVAVENADTAEAIKLTENIFRAVNIALVNELKVIYEAMGIDIWEVIEGAKTKPFGFMPFYPGPGLGGHCIPIDPFYLTWQARNFGVETRFIELAGEINTAMPAHVVARLGTALGGTLTAKKILVLGLAYKKNVDDLRESPALILLELIEGQGAEVTYHDPFIAEIPPTREHAGLAGRTSVALSEKNLQGFDAVVICTDHDAFDYELIARASALILDTRNAMARHGHTGPQIIKA